MFEWSLSLGNIVTFGIAIVSALWVIASMRAEIRVLDSRLLGVETAINKITDILITVNRQDERIKHIERKIELLHSESSRKLQQILETYSNDKRVA